VLSRLAQYQQQALTHLPRRKPPMPQWRQAQSLFLEISFLPLWNASTQLTTTASQKALVFTMPHTRSFNRQVPTGQQGNNIVIPMTVNNPQN
jgi:hypothetical protein